MVCLPRTNTERLMPDLKHDLVLIPALFCDGGLYKDVKFQLEESINVHVLAAPRDTMDESVAAILEQAPPQFVLGGTSYGASLAIEIALAAPERVKALWIMGADPAAPDVAAMNGLVQTIETNLDGAIDYLAGAVVLPAHTEQAEAFKAMAKRVGADTASKQARSLATKRSVEDKAQALTMPVLAIWGADDAIVPAAKGHGFVEHVQGAEWHVLDDCGHLPTMEKPTEVVAIAREWLQRNGAGSLVANH